MGCDVRGLIPRNDFFEVGQFRSRILLALELFDADRREYRHDGNIGTVLRHSAIFFAAASVPVAADTGDDGGRLVIGQGANSCWAWTRSHEAKAATQGLYTQWVAGFVSGVSWEADDPDILTRMDFDGLMAWMHDYCKANPLAKVTTGAAMLVQELRARRHGP